MPEFEAVNQDGDTEIREPVAPDDGQAVPPRGLAATFRSLRHPNFRLYFFGQIVSLLGTWVQITALMWLTFELTGKSLWTALIAAAQILPTFLIGAWCGGLADRWSKRKLLMCTQGAMALLAGLLAAVVLLKKATAAELVAITLVNGFVQAFDLPARLAFVTDLVSERDDVMNAVALNALSFNVARALGPAVAGWFLVLFGPGQCFLVNSLSYLAVLGALACMRVEQPRKRHETGGALRAFLAGFRYLAHHPELLVLLCVAGLLALCGWPFMSLLPAFAQDTLGVDERGYSFLVSGTGCGALLAALSVASFATLERRRHFLGLGIVLIGAALIGLSLARVLIVAVFCCGLTGFGLILFFSTSQGVIQLGAEEHNRGRVMGIWAMTLSGGLPLGNLIVGPAADRWGVPVVLGVQAGICLLAAAGLLLLFRFRRPAEEPS